MSIKQNLISTLSNITLGQSITESMRTGYGPFSFQKYLKSLSRYRKIKQAMKHDLYHFFCSQRFYLDNFSPQSTPLVLIPHLNHSNSTPLLHYFDGHPQLNVCPMELNLSQTDCETWPDFEFDHTPDSWFDILFDPRLSSSKSIEFSSSSITRKNFPFVFSPHLQKALFSNYLNFYKVSSKRVIFDTFFSAFFVAWLNNQNISLKKKKYNIIASKFFLTKESISDFFEIYPDGRLILILCDPTEWLQFQFTIISNFTPVNHDRIINLLKDWETYARCILDAKAYFNGSVCIISNFDLIKNIENVMLYLTKFLHIDFDKILLSTTYNKIPICCDPIKFENRKIFFNVTNSNSFTLADSDFQAINELTENVYKKVIQNLDSY